jgi:hypothetical protein
MTGLTGLNDLDDVSGRNAEDAFPSHLIRSIRHA